MERTLLFLRDGVGAIDSRQHNNHECHPELHIFNYYYDTLTITITNPSIKP